MVVDPFAMMDEVDAVAVCTPDALHAPYARAALERGKHVVVEFPLTRTVEDAQSLYALADASGVVLHVEHIERLSPTSRVLRSHLEGRTIDSASLVVRGPPRQHLIDLATAHVAAIHRIAAALGAIGDVAVHTRKDTHLVASLATPRAVVELDVALVADAPRSLTFRVATDDPRQVFELVDRRLWCDGVELDLGLGDGPPLFAQDHEAVMAAILEGAPPYVGRDDILAGLRVCEQLMAAEPDGTARRE